MSEEERLSIQEQVRLMMLSGCLVWPVMHLDKTLLQRCLSMGSVKYALSSNMTRDN